MGRRQIETTLQDTLVSPSALYAVRMAEAVRLGIAFAINIIRR
jgi:hypothetical protein